MADQEIIVTNGYFNNIKLFGSKTKFVVAAVKSVTPAVAPPYGLKLYFQQWDQDHGVTPGDSVIGNYNSDHPEVIPQIQARFDESPVVFSPLELSEKSLLQIIRELPNKTNDIKDPIFEGDDPDATPPVYPADSPYLMSLTAGMGVTAVQYMGHDDTEYTFPPGEIHVHWEGESWMYFVGVPNSEITPGTPPEQGPEDPHYPGYPTRLIYQFVFTTPQTPTGDPAYPGTDSGDDDTTTNKWITASKLMGPVNNAEAAIADEFLPITLSWERLSFDYIIETREVNGVNRQVIVIKNLKRLGR